MTDPKTHAQVRGDRNCPTCRGTGVRDCSGSILYDNDGSVRSSSSATTPCHCTKPAPAVPDDVAETAKRLRQATFTKGRMHGGIIGQTIEAAMRSTFHEVSAWDLITAADALEAQAAELEQTKAEISAIQHPQSGGSWYREADIDRLQSRADRAEAENARLRRLLLKVRDWNWIDLDEDREAGVDVETFLPELCRLDAEITAALAQPADASNGEDCTHCHGISSNGRCLNCGTQL